MKPIYQKAFRGTVVVLLLAGNVVLPCLSFIGYRQPPASPIKHYANSFDLRVSQAEKHYLDGDIAGALVLEDSACQQASVGVTDRNRRAQLNGCAMDYCNYGRKDKAIALLSSIPASDDVGQQTQELLAGMLNNDPAFRSSPIPAVRHSPGR